MTRREGMQRQKSSSRILPRLWQRKRRKPPGLCAWERAESVAPLSWWHYAGARVSKESGMMIRARYRERQIAVAIGARRYALLLGTLLRKPATFSASITARRIDRQSSKKGHLQILGSLGLVGRFLSSWQARERKQGYSLLRGIAQIILFGATEDALKQEELRNPPPEKRVRFQAAWRSLSSVVMGDVKPTGNGANHGGPSRKIGQGGVVHESKNRRSSGSAIPVSSLCILFLDACGAA
jgi:hypothetical protein